MVPDVTKVRDDDLLPSTYYRLPFRRRTVRTSVLPTLTVPSILGKLTKIDKVELSWNL